MEQSSPSSKPDPTLIEPRRNLKEFIVWDQSSTSPPILPEGYSPGSAESDNLATAQYLDLTKKMSDGDPLWENIVEFVDITGVASYDDAWRAYEDYKNGDIGGLEFMIEGVGALPVVGRIKKIIATSRMANNPLQRMTAKAIDTYGKARTPVNIINKGDALQDIDEDQNNGRVSDTLNRLLYGK